MIQRTCQCAHSRDPCASSSSCPALTEATSPYWRPIKYSLFPPLGLATLAAYLRAGRRGGDRRRARRAARRPTTGPTSSSSRSTSPTRSRAYRARRRATARRASSSSLGGLHVTSLPDEAAPHADAIFLGPGEQTFPQFLDDFRAGRPQRRYVSTSGRTLERVPPIRRDLIRRRSLPRAELDRRHARLSAALRLLLQGRVLRGRPLVLHPARGRRARRDRSAAGTASLLPRRSPARRSRASPRRSSTACAAWAGCSRARRPSTRSCAAT